jgi:hypothetical protein
LIFAGPALADEAVTLGDREGRQPAIATDEKGIVHAAFVSYEPGGKVPDVFHASSSDGRTWEAVRNVSRSTALSYDPAIACGKGGLVAIVWVDTGSKGMASPDIEIVLSGDGGKSWSAPVNVSRTPGKSMDPAVAIAPDGTIHVVWSDTTRSEVGPSLWHVASTDRGASWSVPGSVLRSSGDARHASIACGKDGALHVVWVDQVGERTVPDIAFATSHDGGKTFTRPLDLSMAALGAADPGLAVDDTGIYAVWAEASKPAGGWGIKFAASRDGGRTWEPPLDLAPTIGRSTEPAIASDRGKIAVVWRDTSRHEPSPDVWITLSADEGKTFGETHNLSNNPGTASHACVALAGGRIFVSWQESDRGFCYVLVTTSPFFER